MLVRTTLVITLTVALVASHLVRAQDRATAIRRDSASAGLAPTRHVPVPGELSQFWLVPNGVATRADAASSTPAMKVGRGIQLINTGDYAGGFPLVSGADAGRSGIALYAQYYTGLALVGMSRPAEAEAVFAAVRERKPLGYLKEAVVLRLAESAVARGDAKRALELLDDLSGDKVASPDTVTLMLARAAEQTGDVERAIKAYRKVYYEMPVSAGAVDAQAAITRLQPVTRPLPDKAKLDFDRAEALFTAKRWAPARAAFEPLARVLQGSEARQVALRLAECDFNLDRFRAARDGLLPLLEDDARETEARYYHLSATRSLGDQAGFVNLALKLAEDHPSSPWTEEALNSLASHYIRNDDDDDADRTFRLMLASFPRGKYGERAAWRVGWRAYRQRDYRGAVEVFERAAAAFPRADNRPGWLYWSARGRDLLNDSPMAVDRYAIVIADYGNSYYGRLAVTALGGRRTMAQTTLPAAVATTGVVTRPETIATDTLIRELVALQLYEDALREVQYAQRQWGDSPQLQATTAYIRHNQGLTLKADERFNAVRGAITTMRRAYPQFMAAGGEDLPPEVLRIIFPIDYWPLITKYSKLHELDPYLVAALMAQESTFTAEIRSSANAYGLLQLIPATGSRYAKKLGIRNFSTRMLTDPETNVRLGTEYFSDLMARFGSAHYALAGYNAGEGRVQQWLDERGQLPADEFTDDIPFSETQTYVKRILGTAEDYRRLYGGGLLDPNASLSAQAAQASARSATPPAPAPASTKPAASSTSSTTKKAATSSTKKTTSAPKAKTSSTSKSTSKSKSSSKSSTKSK